MTKEILEVAEGADSLIGALGTKLTEMEEKLKKYPPIDPEKLRRLLVYSLSELKGYAGLSAREKLILDVSEFEALRAWAFGRKEEDVPVAEEAVRT